MTFCNYYNTDMHLRYEPLHGLTLKYSSHEHDRIPPVYMVQQQNNLCNVSLGNESPWQQTDTKKIVEKIMYNRMECSYKN